MNEVARAVEREFDEQGYSRLTENPALAGYAHAEVVDDYRTLQRLLREAAFLLRSPAISLTTWERRRNALLAELPEGYGNE